MTHYLFTIQIDGITEPDTRLCARHVKEAVDIKRDLMRFDVPITILDIHGPDNHDTCDWCNQEQEESADEGANQ